MSRILRSSFSKKLIAKARSSTGFDIFSRPRDYGSCGFPGCTRSRIVQKMIAKRWQIRLFNLLIDAILENLVRGTQIADVPELFVFQEILNAVM